MIGCFEIQWPSNMFITVVGDLMVLKLPSTKVCLWVMSHLACLRQGGNLGRFLAQLPQSNLRYPGGFLRASLVLRFRLNHAPYYEAIDISMAALLLTLCYPDLYWSSTVILGLTGLNSVSNSSWLFKITNFKSSRGEISYPLLNGALGGRQMRDLLSWR